MTIRQAPVAKIRLPRYDDKLMALPVSSLAAKRRHKETSGYEAFRKPSFFSCGKARVFFEEGFHSSVLPFFKNDAQGSAQKKKQCFLNNAV